MKTYYPNRFYLDGLDIFLHIGFRLLINIVYLTSVTVYKRNPLRYIVTSKGAILNGTDLNL